MGGVTSRVPFRSLGALGWLKLVLAGVAVAYALFTVWSLLASGLFGSFGVDYRALYASAQIARSLGFAEVYNLASQDNFQRPLFAAYAHETRGVAYSVVPMPYLPAFIALLVPFVALDPPVSFAVWVGLNAAAATLYLRRFLRAIGAGHRHDLLLPVLLSFPAFLNLACGQVSVLMLVFVGEFLLALMAGRRLQSGLWLGGLLLKPQALVILVPALLIGRQLRVLVGLALAALAILLLSIALAGVEGVLALAGLVFSYTSGLPTNNPEDMMNWRAFALNLGALLPGEVAWALALVGLVLTGGAALWAWSAAPAGSAPCCSLLVLAAYAATCAVAWHSHVHMALPLALPLLCLVAAGRLPPTILYTWSLLPGLVFIIAGLSGFPAMRPTGLATLGLSVLLQSWAIRTARRLPQGH